METSHKQTILPDDWDDFVRFISTHRNEIVEGAYDLRIETDWARDLTEEDLLLLVEHCPSSRLTIASATKSVVVLKQLSADNSDDVREAVADNPRTPADTLSVLSRDSIAAVRMAVAENANVPIDNLTSLATDPANYVRWGVAHNEKTPQNLLEPLVKDPDPHVRDEAKRNPNAPKRGLLAKLFGRS